jgi:hypothetical protein
MSDSYSPSEEALIRQALSRGQAPLCPRCGSRLRRTPVLPPAAVSYVRDRILLECDSCGRKTVLDRG